MLSVWAAVHSRLSSQRGLTSAQYAVIAALIALVAIVGAVFLGSVLDAQFKGVGTP